MAELTINQIKEKKKILEAEIKAKIIEFTKETQVSLNGTIGTSSQDKNWGFVSLNYSNPF